MSGTKILKIRGVCPLKRTTYGSKRVEAFISSVFFLFSIISYEVHLFRACRACRI